MIIDCWVSVDKGHWMPCCHGNNTWQCGCIHMYTQSHSHYYMSTLLSGACDGTVSLDRWASERENLDSATQCDSLVCLIRNLEHIYTLINSYSLLPGLVVPGLLRISPFYIIVNTIWRGRPGIEATLSPDTCHESWPPLHSPSGEGRGQGELSWWCESPEIELVM